MEQTERIGYMEKILNEGTAAVAALEDALDRYTALAPRLEELFEYYGSARWFADLEDDEAGRLPDGLCRGVLSEDAVYDLISDCRRIEDMLAGFAQL